MPATVPASAFDVTALGVVNMFGATISMAAARVANLNIHTGSTGLANGKLNSLGGMMGDIINGNVLNNGSLGFGGAVLHPLFITGATGGGFYTQGSSGTLALRLDNGTGAVSPSDVLTVAATATLNGTLSLSAFGGALADGQAWVPIVYGAFAGDFTSKIFPADGNPGWASGPPGVTTYPVTN